MADRSDLERFIRHVDLSVDGCWFWLGTRAWKDYGKFDSTTAHRAAYEIFVGPIPAKLVIDHLCRNPRCVRPDHLEAVTHAENIRRAYPEPSFPGLPCPMPHAGVSECRICLALAG